jgi:hypothetical protein
MMPSTICGFYGAPEQICSETVVSVISVEPFYGATTRREIFGKSNSSQNSSVSKKTGTGPYAHDSPSH